MLQFSDTHGLFEHFEVNAAPFWPKLGRLIGASAALHLLLLLTIAFVPPVRDALNIAMIFSDSSIVDRPYTKTEIEDLSVITEITNEKFHYPEGYFAMDQMPLPSPTPTPPPLMASAPFVPAPVPPSQLDPLATPTPTVISSPLAASNGTPCPSPNAEE